VLGDVGPSHVEAAAAVITAGISIYLTRRPTVAAMPPDSPSQHARPTNASAVPLPAEIEEKIFIAEDTHGTLEDDIAARNEAIALLQRQLAEAKTAEERMPIRRRLRELRGEISDLAQTKTAAGPEAPRTFFDPVWTLVYKLPPLGRRTRPWLAAVIGLFLGGIGLAVYFRKLADVPILLVLVVGAYLLGTYVLDIGHWWIHGGLASFYGYLRAESSNRRFALRDASAPTLAAPGGTAQPARP
jgi:hypothetical protein